MNAVSYLLVSLPTYRLLLQRWCGVAHSIWRAHRERALAAARARALEELSDETRRDLGLGERRLPDPRRSAWADFGREGR